jgi:DNA-binding NarL/FixJ family response regulator
MGKAGTFSLLLLIAVSVLPRCSLSYTLPTTTTTTTTLPVTNTRIHSNKNVLTRQQLYNNNNEHEHENEETTEPIETETLLSPEQLLVRKRANSWILLVEDEEPIRRAVGDFFLDKGYQVTTCSDGAAALQLLARSSKTTNTNTNTNTNNIVDNNNNDTTNTTITGEKKETITNTNTNTNHHLPKVPDCIVSDIRMPVMDGLELLRNIRNENNEYNSNHYNANANTNTMHMLLSHVPVVLLTAKGYTQDRIAGYDAGADAYLTKPFSPDELVAIVDNLIQRSTNLSVEHTDTTKDVGFDDLARELHHIKTLLLHKGGAGKFGNGWVERTNIFLSTDERAVLELLSQGLMTKEIAVRTHLSTRKIEQLLTGMFRKIGVKNRTELVRWAVSTGNVE